MVLLSEIIEIIARSYTFSGQYNVDRSLLRITTGLGGVCALYPPL